ncbi:hypothetical protein GCM10027187_59370 [Streptosporangium sandarakinum]
MSAPASWGNPHHPGNRRIFQVFAALAGFIGELIAKGFYEGLAAVKARGVRHSASWAGSGKRTLTRSQERLFLRFPFRARASGFDRQYRAEHNAGQADDDHGIDVAGHEVEELAALPPEREMTRFGLLRFPRLAVLERADFFDVPERVPQTSNNNGGRSTPASSL